MPAWDEFAALASAAGVPATFGLFVIYVLYKNGFLKIIMRDGGANVGKVNADKITSIEGKLSSLEAKIHDLETLTARLDERTKRGN